MREQDFFKQDKYISLKEYNEYCTNNNLEAKYDYLNKRNDEFVNNKVQAEKEYLDTIFTNVGEKIILDEEQRKIVINDDDYCIINAGAGSGKSTTMAAKVKYLVEKQHINPKDIIMLSFTKKSSEDLDEKVNTLLKLGIPISTFHSLGFNIVRENYKMALKVADEDEQNNIIIKYISSIFHDKEKLLRLTKAFKKVIKDTYFAQNFIQNMDKFSTFEDYFEDYKRRKYEKEARNGGISRYVKNRLESTNNLYTIRGEKCKSIAEVKIADYLYINGIDYEYERVFDELVDDYKTYRPDFTIEYAGKKIYIEYFGLSTYYVNNELTEINRKKYDRVRSKKEEFQRNNNYDFINLDYKKDDVYYLETLKKELYKRNIKLQRKTDDEIFDKIISGFLSAEFFKFCKLIIDFIDIFKNMLVDDERYFFARLRGKIAKGDIDTHYYSMADKEEKEWRIETIKFLEEIYFYYENQLVENNMIDYNDMISKSYKYLQKTNYVLPYKYIIVDEYQDITFQRFLLIKQLLDKSRAKLVTVGDDWQSIYAFNGAKIDLFTKFCDYFENANDNLFLSTTYRYGQQLTDITSEFIRLNKDQTEKTLTSTKDLENPIKIIQYLDGGEINEVHKLVHKIYEKTPKANILILARTNKLLNLLGKSEYFSTGINDVIICNDLVDAKIEAITMHRSKGLTADEVIVIGLNQKIFPSNGWKEHWIFDYFKLDSLSEITSIEEERRLFYVALTRTKNSVYLLVPNEEEMSSFVSELKNIITQNDNLVICKSENEKENLKIN